MKAGFIVGGILLMVVGALLFFTIICFAAGLLLGVIGLVMLIYGLAASDRPIVYQQYPPQYQQPYPQPQYPPSYSQPQQYPVQSQPQYQQAPQGAPPPRYEPSDTVPPTMSEPDIELVICSNCGAGNPPDVTFCGQCAANIREEVMPTQ